MTDKKVVGRNTTVKKEVKTHADGTKVTTITTTTTDKHADGTETTQTEVKTQTEKSGSTNATTVTPVPGPSKPAAGSRQPRESHNPSKAQVGPPGKTDEKFLQAALKAHNDLRAKHSSPPLVLDPALCASAQQWADKIAAQHKMEHSSTELGENVYWSTQTITEGNIPVESWYGEIKDFNFKKMEPQKGTGHFTQVIWKETKRFGIARAIDSKGQSYIVAQYDPPGNFIGHYAANISKPK